jgi:hypothetical protein
MKTQKLMRFNDFPNKQASTPIIFQISLQKIEKFKQTNDSIVVESTHTSPLLKRLEQGRRLLATFEVPFKTCYLLDVVTICSL